jgi:C_GCAxxG_C_C family probable redox protein
MVREKRVGEFSLGVQGRPLIIKRNKEGSMDRVELAVSLFKEGFSCSQALLAAFGDRFGVDREIALRIAAGFGGGMGRMAQTCGAVTGAFMLIGLKFGSIDAKDRQAKEKAQTVVREFAKRFISRNDFLLCRELLGCDISTPEGSQFAKEKKLFATNCPKYVKVAAEIVDEMI